MRQRLEGIIIGATLVGAGFVGGQMTARPGAAPAGTTVAGPAAAVGAAGSNVAEPSGLVMPLSANTAAIIPGGECSPFNSGNPALVTVGENGRRLHLWSLAGRREVIWQLKLPRYAGSIDDLDDVVFGPLPTRLTDQ